MQRQPNTTIPKYYWHFMLVSRIAERKEEEMESEEEITKMEEEEVGAGKEMEKACIGNLKVWTLVLSFLQLGWFIPDSVSMVGFIPYYMPISNKYGTNIETCPTTFLDFLLIIYGVYDPEEKFHALYYSV
jgi:hypothetical protein